MGTAVILLITVALVSASVVPEPRPPQRIVGGEVTTIQSYPFGSSLLFSTDLLFYQQWCGGAIINNRSILSAAHCFYGRSPAQWRSRVGSTWANSGGTVINTQQILIYPGYEHHILDNDVAILRTATTINYITDTVQPGSISGVNYNLADNEIVWAIGWGTTSFGGSFSEQLRHVQIWTINQEICRSRYAELNLPITDSMLCAGWLDVGGRDQCSGDSGGPVLHNNVIVGICSWGFMCAHPRYPGVNARVSSYSAWIQANA